MHNDHNEVPAAVEAIGVAILDAAFKVHRTLGPGLLEGAYEAFLAHELERTNHKVDRQLALPAIFEGARVGIGFRLDLMVDDLVPVEIKAVEQLLPVHEAQLLTYLRLSRRKLGYLINFNVAMLKQGIKRKVM